MKVLQFFAATTVFSLAIARPESEKRGDLDVLEIEFGNEIFGSEYMFKDSELGAFVEALHGDQSNESLPQLRDRSAELVGRQQCNAGYGYCSAFNGCCPSSNRCCSYGYCLEPGKTCCPSGPCGEGKTCCENKCIPIGAQCCRGGDYCEAGNMCVLYEGRRVCCTDLKCTAVVTGGSTSFAKTTTRAPAPPAPTITQPPRTTQVVVDSFTTYYWTVRWRYFSYYWTIFQARSTVTYTTITYTTIYTTTAKDDGEASAIFAELSRTLTFSTPAEATTLASLVNAAPGPTAAPTTALDTELGSLEVPGPTSQDISLDSPGEDETTSGQSATRASNTGTSSRVISSSSAPSIAGGGSSAAGSVMVQVAFLTSAICSGILMVWL